MAADFNAGVLTDKGKALLAKWHEGSCVPELTRAAAGAGTYSSGEDLSGRTALKDERMSIGFSHIETQNETTVALRFTLTNEDLTEGFTITEIGVFATDPDEGEILYNIATTADESTADYMPAYNGEYPTTIIFNYQIEVANATSVTIVAGSTGMYALAADLEAAEVKIENLETATADLEDQIEDAVKELEEDIVVKVDEAKEAADKAQETADQAVSDAANAQSTAEFAQSTADQAVKDAASAQSTADQAVANASTAQSTAEKAQSTADQAVANASEAQSAADAAQKSADAAQTSADSASIAAASAQSTADQAVTNAATAQSTAEKAQTTADQASTAAATAQTTAEAAQSTADEALETAENVSQIYYGTCSTAASTAAKVVTCSGFVLETGATICVCFTNANSASSPTMNVNSTGAKSITAYGTTAASTYTWRAGGVMIFTYDGTSWVINNFSVASTSYYGVTKLSDSTSSTSTSLAATANAVGTAYSLANTANTTADSAASAAATAQSTADSAKSGLTDGSVTKVGTSTVGGAAKPIYLDGGTPTACSLYPTTTFSLATGSWSSNTSGDYNYRYQLSVSGVTADTIALAFLDTSCASVAGDAGMCSVVESSSGTLTFRAVDKPTAAITGSVVLLNS